MDKGVELPLLSADRRGACGGAARHALRTTPAAHGSGDVPRNAVGCRTVRGVRIPGRAAALDRGMDVERDGGSGDHVDPVRAGALLLPRVEVGAERRRDWRVLRTRAQ